ncbi:MAG: 2OG-Fe dioxygenase family protein [Coleofasciculaceae cyanobacterium SM2_1_6]|nr:2OG-Fe dioxygenase family protein [Coleofasciculaceae cyanobacterium SM2_1_6]
MRDSSNYDPLQSDQAPLSDRLPNRLPDRPTCLEPLTPNSPVLPFTSRRGTFSIATDLRPQVEQHKYAIATAAIFHLTEAGKIALGQLQKSWEYLEYDAFYGEKHPSCQRRRRYTEFDYAPKTGTLHPRQHQPYIQSEEMNAYAGGKVRHFGDLQTATYENPLFQDLVDYNFSLFPLEEMWLDRAWICQVHIMRIIVGRADYGDYSRGDSF